MGAWTDITLELLNIFKMYGVPFITWSATLFGGWLLARWGFNKSESHIIEKEKIINVNELSLSIFADIQGLLSVKSIYYTRLTDNPIQRLLVIPPIANTLKPIEFNIGLLSFIIKGNNKTIKNNENDWLNLPRILAFIDNYNLLINFLEDRNRLMIETNEILLKDAENQPVITSDPSVIIKKLSPLKVTYLFDRTEQLITLLDHVLVEGRSFLTHFPYQVSELIKVKELKRFGYQIIKYPKESNEIRIELFKTSVNLDLDEASRITGRTDSELKAMFFYEPIKSK